MSDYKDYKIKDTLYSDDKDLRLESTYELCVNELGLQQSKRDQIIAFYIAIVSFALPAIIGMQINQQGKATGILALFLLGTLLAKVVIRYRIYKEVYWITCRTISQLYSFKQEKITKILVQHLFYENIKKSRHTVIEFKKNNNDKQVDHITSFKRIFNSAETILYEVLILMNSFVLWVGIYLLFNQNVITLITALITTLIYYVYCNISYYKGLTQVYAVIINEEDRSFNKTYEKAWFLHSFYNK